MRIWKRNARSERTGWEKFRFGCGLFLLVWFLLFVFVFKSIWGYVVIRPAVHQDLFRMSKLEGIGYFRLSDPKRAATKESWILDRLKAIPESSSRGGGYYDLQVQSFVAMRRAGFDPAKAPELPKSEVEKVIDAFRSSGVMPRDEYFDRRLDRLSGVVVAFRAHDGEQLYFIAADEGPNWYDQIPYFEVLFDRHLNVFHAQSYRVEWAGVEGAETPMAVLYSGVVLLLLVGVSLFVYGLYRLVLTIRDAFS